MKAIILGAGRRGIRLARYLIETQNDVVIIDNNPTYVNVAMNSVDCIGFLGNGTDANDLNNAGISDADAFIALTSDEETNLIACAIASSQFNVPLTIATVRTVTYTDKINASNLLGISHIVNPSIAVAGFINREINHGLFSDLVTFDNSSLVLYNVDVDSTSKFTGKLVRNIRKSVPGDYVIATIFRNGQAFVPSGDTEILSGDKLSIVANDNSLSKILQTVGIKQQKPKKTVIIGATSITDFLLKQIHPSERKHFTVIAKDPAGCQTLSEKYPEVKILNRNISSEGIFEQEGLGNSDLLLAMTDNDELNILTASYAKTFGVKSSIALINKNPGYKRMAEHLQIDSLISTQDVTVDTISDCLSYVKVSNTRTILNGEITTFEFNVSDNCPINGQELKDIDIRGKGIIAGVTNTKGTFIPGGQYRIKSGDRLMIVATKEGNAAILKLFREK